MNPFARQTNILALAQKKNLLHAQAGLSCKRSWSLSFDALLDGRASLAGYRADGLSNPGEGDLLPFFPNDSLQKAVGNSNNEEVLKECLSC